MKKLWMLMMMAFLAFAAPSSANEKWDASGWQSFNMEEAVAEHQEAQKAGRQILWVAVLLLWLVIFGALGMWLGEMRGRAKEGAIFGALLGSLGLVIACLIPERQKAVVRAPERASAKPAAAPAKRKAQAADEGSPPVYKL
jgi:hypothetical protein